MENMEGKAMRSTLAILILVVPALAWAANLRIEESISEDSQGTALDYMVVNNGTEMIENLRLQVRCVAASGSARGIYTLYVSPGQLAPGSSGGASLHVPPGGCQRTQDRRALFTEGRLPVRPPGAPDPRSTDLKSEPF
jgi:hypothetical protein